ncbi:protein MCM10 homolog [Drosophila pseudoobscura]|uniref:Protein MCM10 homolog n=1 Tax=Drosophila pseudoobscura pseudoobscura TaxID=46245 RepID=Q29NT4_DROPS|nr:protein MCM10 homolog [Drosophila pseudoobscura]XP_033236879.1 protein MCM10 homolog [Drosophila pseudoobscura]XP_033236880.1 protein MCM10 homolog [Drosophila pseudoobscura]
MSPANVSKPDLSIDEEDEILALEKLLGEAENDNAETAPTPAAKSVAAAPRLREDSSFANAFSFEKTVKPAAKSTADDKATPKEPELDSSDDEEVKNFLERKYNEYGTDINKTLKQQRESAHESKVAREVDQDIKTTKFISSTPQPLKNPHNPIKRQGPASSTFQRPVSAAASNPSTPQQPVSAVYTDPVFGLRMINPLISSTLLQERMGGRKAVPFSGVAYHIEQGDLAKDWVLAGALVSKQPVKNTKKGDPYSTWKLSDLRGEVKTVSIFLFKEAHKTLWKTAEGMCLAVLNPTIFERRAGSSDVACLSIDSSHKVMILGQSKDLGTCRANKKNGDKCTAIVNLSECDYCVFHVKAEYGKMSRRSELQSATAGRGLNELRNKVLGKTEVFYGGQSFTAVPAKKSSKLIAKERDRLSKLAGYDVSPFAHTVDHVAKPRTDTPQNVPYAERGGPVSRLAGGVEASSKQRLQDLERVRLLKAENDRFEKESKGNVLGGVAPGTPTAKATPTPGTPTTPSSVPDKFKNRGFSFDANLTPKLSGSENFSLEVNIGARQAASAKLRAAALLKKKPLEKVNPNSTRGSETGKRRAIDDLNEKFSTSAKRQKIDEDERELMRKSRIERIMAATSSHTNLVEMREREAQEEYFNKLERKEAMEEKMLGTFKMPCKAVICQQCKYTAFSAADRCKQERHPLKVVDAEKRFFQCKDCGNRTTTVFKLPKQSCKSCKGSRWERAAMIREKKVCTGRESLSVRGDEETFLGSVASSASLNLLVPAEE